jgi:ribosomal protein S18 acetylase RimI-like enzyme
VEGISIQPARELRVRGSVLRSVVADARSPITYGYGDKFAVYFNQAPILQVASSGGAAPPSGTRASGRGGPSDPDIPQGRPHLAPQPRTETRPGEEPQSVDELLRESLRPTSAPPDLRPRVVLKFAEERELLISGMLAGGRELAGKPAVVDVPVGKGHIVLFAINPMWRDQTQGSYFLLFNAMMHQDHLGVGRTNASQSAKQTTDAQ